MSRALRVAVYGLIYGDYFDLHKRFVESLMKALPFEDLCNGNIRVTLYGNQPGARTLDLMSASTGFRWLHSAENLPKYKLMREKLFDVTSPDDYDWMVWFDDDSWITDTANWWNRMMQLIESKKDENICYIGEPWYWNWRGNQWKFVTESSWFRNVPPEVDARGRKRVTFAQGGLWWLRRDVRKLLDWPDVRLSHNGGDTLLGEAVRQQRLPFHKVGKSVGFKTNDAERRGLSETPAGVTV